MNGLQAPDGVLVLRTDSLLAWVLPYGARLMQLFWLHAPEGPRPLTLGFAQPHAYLQDTMSMGAVCGRYANRIGGAVLERGGVRHSLDANHPMGHCIHGGRRGWGQRIWQVAAQGPDCVDLVLDSAHGDMGFPGNCRAHVQYRLEGAGLIWQARAQLDRACPVNLLQHSYWNLAAQADLRGHLLQVDARHYHPLDPQELPQDAAPVAGTCFDFRRAMPVDPACVPHLDGALLLDSAPGALRSVARLAGGGLVMGISTDRPYLHVYASAGLRPTAPALGMAHGPGAALCLESEDMPNGPARGADVWYGPQRDYGHTLRLDFSSPSETGSLD